MKNLVFGLPKAINSGTQIAALFNCGFWKHPSIGFKFTCSHSGALGLTEVVISIFLLWPDAYNSLQ